MTLRKKHPATRSHGNLGPQGGDPVENASPLRLPAKAVLTLLVVVFVAGAATWLLRLPVGNDLDSQTGELSSEAPKPIQAEESSTGAELAQDSTIGSRRSRLAGEADRLALEGPSLTDSFIERLGTIVSTEARSFPERHAAVQALGDELTEQEILALYRFLLAPPPDGELNRRQDRVIKNDLLNRLRNQKEPPLGLTGLLAAIFDDSGQDEIVRDYALQQMRAWHDDAPSEDRPLIYETVSRALEETQSSIGGTALLALRQFEGTATGDGVTHAALTMLHAENTSELSRITAMQVAVERTPESVAPLATQWALDPASSYPRRLSAIAALGAIGSIEVAAILARVEAQQDPNLRAALQAAYRKHRQAGSNVESNETQ